MNSKSFIRVQKKYFFEFKFEFGKMIDLSSSSSQPWYYVPLSTLKLVYYSLL